MSERKSATKRTREAAAPLAATDPHAEISVGIRELRDHLSAYLDVVKGGRAVKVTEHGVVIASIVPMHISARTLELYRQGKVGLPRLPKGDPADFPKLDIPGGITDILLEMREEERNR